MAQSKRPSHSTDPSAVPGSAEAEKGYVLLNGPAGTAITFMPQAARITGQSLIDAADIAIVTASK